MTAPAPLQPSPSASALAGDTAPSYASGGSADAAPSYAGGAQAVYDSRCARFAAERDRYTAAWNRVANVRLLLFMLAVAALGWGVFQGVSWLLPPGLVLLALFIGFVVWHRRLGRQRSRYAELWAMNNEARKRFARDWAALPVRHTVSAPPGHPYAADLDLFGPASPFQLLDSMGTRMGETLLRDWLLAPAPPAVVRARQVAVAELAPQIDLRDEVALRGRLLGEPKPDPTAFLAWAESPPWLFRYGPLLVLGRVSVALLLILLVANLSNLVAYPFWLIPLAYNSLLWALLAGRVRDSLQSAVAGQGAFARYADAFDVLAAPPFQSPVLQQAQAALTAGGLPAGASLRRLGRRAQLYMPEDYILNIPFQIVGLWNLQVLAALEAWQRVAGGRVRGWLAALGEVEALAALAVLAHDNPDWTFPTLDPAAPALTATALGHPLLAATARVANSVQVGPRGTFLLVTGSNMSGKSTLLRAIGVNLVLAGAGGPVCAAAFSTPPVTLWTSMRIQDSLASGVSYFMAELQRLKAIVDAAGHTQGGDTTFCYLLDEILQGTNTAERQIAARRIISHLVHVGALGAVSTHDLALADAPDMAALAQPVHLREQFTSGPAGPSMAFDYHLRPGLATSTNALRLMQIVGLDVE